METINVASSIVATQPGLLSTPDAATLLENAYSNRGTLQFFKQLLEIPPLGNLYTIETLAGSQDRPLPDGYGFMDDEALAEKVMSASDREVYCFERKYGFRKGEHSSSVSRRRYRLAVAPGNTVLQLVHYFPCREPVPIVRNPKVLPRAIQIEQQVHFPGAVQQRMPVSAAPGFAKTDDVSIPVGDSLDFISTRDLAVDRYKRNHQFMAEILSPYAVAEIVRPSIFQGVDTAWLKSLAKKGDDGGEQLQDDADRFSRRLKLFEAAEERLKGATPAEIDEIVASLKHSLE